MRTTTVLLIILIIATVGFHIWSAIDIKKVAEKPRTVVIQSPITTTPDTNLVHAIHQLTDAILSSGDTMVQESNETQAIWKEIRDRHYSPY